MAVAYAAMRVPQMNVWLLVWWLLGDEASERQASEDSQVENQPEEQGENRAREVGDSATVRGCYSVAGSVRSG